MVKHRSRVKRRTLLSAAVAAMTVKARGARADFPDDPSKDPVRRWGAGATPLLAVSHVGFVPGVGQKSLVVRANGATGPTRVALFDAHHNTQKPGEEPLRWLPLAPVTCDFGPAQVAELGNVPEGRYHLYLPGANDGEWSPTFFVGPRVWRRLLHLAVNYYTAQKCGVAVPGVHPACHLDDAIVEATGKHVDAVGGWHDAGDHVKQAVTILNAVALGTMLRDLPAYSGDDPDRRSTLALLRHGNRGILAQQDPSDGKVWDQIFQTRWTDNKIGTADDRRLETQKTIFGSCMFAAAQGLVSQAFAQTDRAYAQRCLKVGEKALAAYAEPSARTTGLAWQVMAAVELTRAGSRAGVERAVALGRVLAARQSHAAGTKGCFLDADKTSPILGDPGECEVTGTAMPALALLALIERWPRHRDAGVWQDAVAAYLEHVVFALSARNAFAVLPLSVYTQPATKETYRRTEGGVLYRYFFPSRLKKWWQGTNSHYAAHATLLARAAKHLPGVDGGRCINLAYRQLEWIVGRNPFGASMMSGVGARNPYPYSGQVGMINGGVINGIAGNDADEPILDTRFAMDWRTTEYWGPGVSYLVKAITALEGVAV
ncbi:MAG: glycoside hydrolase family 9 protein [Deltaproteobacteria bacterium]|nr:glycoside hydrolase family 9 protein [Deltaproteobacteria bacterium]